MTNKASIITLLLVFTLGGLLVSCQKENNGNELPNTPDTPVVESQIPPIEDYMPERLLHLFDSLNVLYRGDAPPIIEGDFVTESMNRLVIDKVPESPWLLGLVPTLSPYYYEFKDQEINRLSVTFKNPIGDIFIEKSDTDSTYFRIKDNTTLFTEDPIAPPYFKSHKFKAEDFRNAYIIGNGNYFTLYFYEIRDVHNSFLPLNAILVSGKLSADSEGNATIEDFWYGMETMKYYNESEILNMIIQAGNMPTSGDIVIMRSPNTLIQGSYNN